MHNSQDIREKILVLLKARKISVNRMLIDCRYNTNLVNDMRKGKMPSADKIVTIAQYLGVSVEYLMGAGEQTENLLTPFTSKGQIDRELSELIIIYEQLNTQNRKQLLEYIKFLKMQQDQFGNG